LAAECATEKSAYIAANTEMEFWIFLVEVSGHKLESCQTPVFVWFSTFLFLFYKKCNTQVFLFRGFLKPEKSGFLSNPPVEGTVNSMEQKTSSLLLN
jgi:hypothetical protein